MTWYTLLLFWISTAYWVGSWYPDPEPSQENLLYFRVPYISGLMTLTLWSTSWNF